MSEWLDGTVHFGESPREVVAVLASDKSGVRLGVRSETGKCFGLDHFYDGITHWYVSDNTFCGVSGSEGIGAPPDGDPGPTGEAGGETEIPTGPTGPVEEEPTGETGPPEDPSPTQPATFTPPACPVINPSWMVYTYDGEVDSKTSEMFNYFVNHTPNVWPNKLGIAGLTDTAENVVNVLLRPNFPVTYNMIAYPVKAPLSGPDVAFQNFLNDMPNGAIAVAHFEDGAHHVLFIGKSASGQYRERIIVKHPQQQVYDHWFKLCV